MSKQTDGVSIAFQAIALVRGEHRSHEDIGRLRDATEEVDLDTLNFAIVGLASMLVSIIAENVENPGVYLDTLGPTVATNYSDQ